MVRPTARSPVLYGPGVPKCHCSQAAGTKNPKHQNIQWDGPSGCPPNPKKRKARFLVKRCRLLALQHCRKKKKKKAVERNLET